MILSAARRPSMAHRIVVIDALHRKTFGCMSGSITGDHIGLGKTLQILNSCALPLCPYLGEEHRRVSIGRGQLWMKPGGSKTVIRVLTPPCKERDFATSLTTT
jgi:hypothetical protein